MLKNFFKVALRQLLRHAGFSVINIAGLTLGLAAVLLIGLFVYDEKQYDLFLPGGDQVYRVYNDYSNNEGTDTRAVAPPMFATTLKQQYPEVLQMTRILMLPPAKTLFEVGKKQLYEERGLYVDSTFFEVFPLSFTYGARANALANPGSIVLSEELAQRFFGTSDPVGRSVLIDKEPMQVSGVLQTNEKFHLRFGYLLPMAAAGLPAARMESWAWQQFYNYVKLKPGTNAAALEAKFQPLAQQRTNAFNTEGGKMENKPRLQPLKDIHLHSVGFKYDNAVRGNSTYVNALTVIAIFILLIACFNFVNLATAKSLQRAKEVGVRKTVGASRGQLIAQFTGETILLTAVSIVLAVIATTIILPYLNRFTEKTISFQLFQNPILLLLLFLLTIVVGAAAGIYPALVLSGFRAIAVLKGSATSRPGSSSAQWLRQALVVVQFSLSVLLIISATVVFRQVNYLHNKDLGFEKEQIMLLPIRNDNLFNNIQAFKQELLQVPGVSGVSAGYGFPGDAVAGDRVIVPENGQRNTISATLLMTDYDYLKTLGLQLVAGRDFDEHMGTDKDHAFIINETGVRELGFRTAQEALGKTLLWPPWGAQDPDSLKEGQVVGVVKDFHYKSLYDKVGTAVLQIFPAATSRIAVKLKTTDFENTLMAVKQVWSQYVPEYPLEYNFVDDNFETAYRSEDKLRSLLWIFTAVAIFVGCLGLFGLAAYAAERRTKEIGIRKVLGASVEGLVLLLSREFVALVLLALVIAAPVAWYFMHAWLQDFAYRINLSWWIFLAAGGIAVFIAFVTVGFQAIKAATANPVKSLRAE